MIYFISGHRDLTPTEFELYYVLAIRNAINSDNHARFILGACEGADKMALEFLEEIEFDPDRVTIFYDNETYLQRPRSEFIDSVRDAVLPNHEFVDNKATSCSDVDIAFIRPGKEDSYTAKNILRRYLMKE